MKREYPDRPLVGLGAVIIEKGRVALIRRGRAPGLGSWSIPGGALELSETVRQGVVREAREETGLAVEPVELLGLFDRIVLDEQGRTQYHYVLIDFLCRRISGDLEAAGDAAEAAWFKIDEIAELGLAEDTREVIRRGFEKAPRSDKL